MIRKIFTGLMCLFSVASWAGLNCPKAHPLDHSGFCNSFKTAAECYCEDQGLPKAMCKTYGMGWLYKQMISTRGSLEAACANQKYTTKEDCIANWQCYGGDKMKPQTAVNCAKRCEVIFSIP